MTFIEIFIIIATIAFLSFIIGNWIYKKIKKMPTGECACCSHSKKGSNLVKMYKKKYHK